MISRIIQTFPIPGGWQQAPQDKDADKGKTS